MQMSVSSGSFQRHCQVIHKRTAVVVVVVIIIVIEEEDEDEREDVCSACQHAPS